MSYKFDLIKYGTKSIISLGAVYLYDQYVDDRGSAFSLTDGYTAALSFLASDILIDILSAYIPYLGDQSFVGQISRPLLNGIIYMYLYDMLVNSKFQNVRSASENILMGAVSSLLIGYVQSPLSSLFGYSQF